MCKYYSVTIIIVIWRHSAAWKRSEDGPGTGTATACYTCSLGIPDRINRTILLFGTTTVFEYGPIELTTPIICVGVGCPLRTQLSCRWAIRNSILRSNLAISALVQECFDSKRIQIVPAIISASGLIGKLNPKAPTSKSSGFVNFGSNFTMAGTS